MKLRNVIGFLLAVPFLGVAQHDMQRDAVREIAAGNYQKAAAILKKRKKDYGGDAETLFVEMLSLLAQNKIDEAGKKAAAARKAGMPLERFVAGPRDLLEKLPALEGSGEVALVHGPMVGNVTGTSASFWVRTATPAEVTVTVGERTGAGKTTKATDFTTVVLVEGLEPATRHSYQVAIDGVEIREAKSSFMTFPSRLDPEPFRVGFGGGAGYVIEFERMWDTIRAKEPAAFLMLGDNIYIDDPEHSLTHFYCYYRRQSRPEWRGLTASTAIFSIWDDHDFGVNDCVPGPEIESPSWKREVWNIYRQNWVNPGYGGGENQPGCWYDFHIADVHFIMLDGRYYRDRKGGAMLGPVQKAWLRKRLEGSDASFKVIASPVPFTPGIKPGSKDPWDGYPDERNEIFSWIRDGKIEGVFLIAADRHRTDLRTIPNPGAYTLYEFESSRLTNHHTHKIVQTDGLVWGYNEKCSFGLMRFDTAREDPEVIFEAIDIDGDTQDSFTLRKSMLRF